MKLWSLIREYFGGPWRIDGVKNKYYLPDNPHRPVRDDHIFARKSWTGSWSLFRVCDRPRLPVGYRADTGLFGQPTGSYTSFHARKGRTRRIASGLDLSQAFYLVSLHDQQASRLQADIPGRGVKKLLLRKEPV